MEAIGCEVARGGEVGNSCDNYDVRSMMNMKGGTGIPFTAEIAYLGNCDMKNFVL